MYLYVWGKSKNNVGWPDQSAAPSQLLPNQGQGEKTEVPTKCVTPGASSKGTWFPTEFYFKASVLRGVKFLLWKTLSPVDSQVSTRVVFPNSVSLSWCYATGLCDFMKLAGISLTPCDSYQLYLANCQLVWKLSSSVNMNKHMHATLSGMVGALFPKKPS